MSVTSAYRTGVRVLRGSPMLAAMAAGWLASEYPPQVVTARALSSLRAEGVDRFARALGAQGADIVLDRALRDTFGDDYAKRVRHPIEPVGDQDPHGAARHLAVVETPHPSATSRTAPRARHTSSISGVPSPCWEPGTGLGPNPGRRMDDERQARSGVRADGEDGRPRLDLCRDQLSQESGPFLAGAHRGR